MTRIRHRFQSLLPLLLSMMAPRPWQPRLCTRHTILTNRESSELVGERIFYALQVRTRTI